MCTDFGGQQFMRERPGFSVFICAPARVSSVKRLICPSIVKCSQVYASQHGGSMQAVAGQSMLRCHQLTLTEHP